ncbi:Panacea domain-containing protein [Roseateles sp. So40a]|uniref:Panacea domain-containing protein n=1 Tax=Roseateles sp. So40a TaxID=3400226 RepID=UPI003A896EAF
MPSSAQKISEYILAAFQEVGDPITTAKLHKLLYYVQGWHLAHFEEPAFPERIEAWMHGPTVPAVHDLYNGHWGRPIVEPIEAPQDLDTRLRELIDEVIELYGIDTGYSLHIRTRMEDPWLEARHGLSNHHEGCREEVTQESMKRFFKSEDVRKEAA